MPIETPDLLVVGLGPAGSRAAAAAAGAGLAVVAVERRPVAGSPVQCAELVPGLLAQEVDALATVTGQHIGRMLTFVEEDPADETPDFLGRMIDRAAFDRRLAAVAAAAGASCRYGTAIRDIAPDGTVEASDGSRWRPRLVIGADGPRSVVGAAAGRRNRDFVETRQLTVPLRGRHDATDIHLRADYPGGYAWLFPKGARANLGIGLAATARARLKPLLDDLHWRLVAQHRVGAAVLAVTGGAIPVGGRLGAVAAIGRVPVLLAGDAAGLANPVTGAGIAAAVLSGSLAGAAAARWIGGEPGALAAYEEELADLFDVALARALRRRCALLARHGAECRPDRAALRAGRIAYPDYWAA